MAIKFSQFVLKTLPSELDFIVGYKGTENLQITPDNFLAPYLGAYLPLAGGTMTGNLKLNDGVVLQIGSSADLQLFHELNNSYISNNIGDLTIRTLANDKDIIFQADDGSGGITTYLSLQGANEVVYFEKDFKLPDNVKGNFGNAGDLQIYHDGSNSYITDGGTGNLSIGGTQVDILNPGASEYKARFLTDGAVELYHDSVKTFETTATGIEVDATGVVSTNPSYVVATAGTFEMAIGSRNSPGVAQEAFVGTIGNTDWKLKANNVDIGRFTQTKKFVIGRDTLPDSTIEVFTGGNSVHAALLLQHDSFGTGRLCGIGFELGSTQIKSAIAVKADDAAIGTHGRSNIIFCVDSVDDANPVTWEDEKMRITHAGNVGIAVDNPEARLQVNEIPQAGGSTTTASSLVHFVGTTAPSTVNGFATLKLEYPAGVTAGDGGAQIKFTQGYHSGDPDNTQPVGSLRGYRSGADTQYGGGLQLTYQPDGLPLGLLPGITLDGDGNSAFAGNVSLVDNKYLYLGTSNDLQLYHDGTDSYVSNTQNSGDLIIQNGANDKDVVFKCDDGAGGTRTYLYLDGNEAAAGDACWTIWPDNSRIGIGTDKDLQIHHEAGNNYIASTIGDLVISNTANDKDIQFKSDDGAGNITLYYYLDGSIVKNRFPKDVYLEDDVKLLFGDASTPDLEIYHDGSNSYIKDTGTGFLIMESDAALVLQNTAGEPYFLATSNGSGVLYYNGGAKLETTSSGITTYGQMNLAALNTAPASASATGTLGEIRYTADYIYVCTATNTWKRSALSTW